MLFIELHGLLPLDAYSCLLIVLFLDGFDIVWVIFRISLFRQVLTHVYHILVFGFVIFLLSIFRETNMVASACLSMNPHPIS